jgi:hypothetical protein
MAGALLAYMAGALLAYMAGALLAYMAGALLAYSRISTLTGWNSDFISGIVLLQYYK